VETRSELVVPLFLQDRLIGVLDLESAVPHAFDGGSTSACLSRGPSIAVALENARLYEIRGRVNAAGLRHEWTARGNPAPAPAYRAREVPGLDLGGGLRPCSDSAEIL